MTEAERLASFVIDLKFDEIPLPIVDRLKVHFLDALGCAFGALNSPTIHILKGQIDRFGGDSLSSLIGLAKEAHGPRKTSPNYAAFYNSALIRYLDFNDSFLAPDETCHPSDNVGAILAACEYADRSGEDFLLAMAIAYYVQCRLSQIAPVRKRGFDHVVQGTYAVASGMSKALGLTRLQTANALAMAGTAFNALRVTRTGELSNWKGLAYPNMVLGVAYTTFLAMDGITGPLSVFEGAKGFEDSISGVFETDWKVEGLGIIAQTILKKFNAEIHSQSVLEGILELRQSPDFQVGKIDQIQIKVFDVAYNIIGGGNEGDKRNIKTKEQADHSLAYLTSVAILDGQVMPEQFSEERINRPDVQNLMEKIHIRPEDEFSLKFPKEMKISISVHFTTGTQLTITKTDFEGFHTRPADWETVINKFNKLSAPFANADLREEIIISARSLEDIPIAKLMGTLKSIKGDHHGKKNYDRGGISVHPL